jgi:hypothetical protein
LLIVDDITNRLNVLNQLLIISKDVFFSVAIMLTKSSLLYLNFCNEYRDLRHAKKTSGVSREWLEQAKVSTVVRHRGLTMKDSSDDSSDDTTPAIRRATSRPSKKRITDSGVAIVSRVQALPPKHPRKARTSGNAEMVCDEEPMGALNSCHYGGLDDEDDTQEWEAIRQSPVKERGVRIVDDVRCHSLIGTMLMDLMDSGHRKNSVTG